MFTVAAAPLRMPKALTIGGGMRSWGWLILKFESDLCDLSAVGITTRRFGALPLRLGAPVPVGLDLDLCQRTFRYLVELSYFDFAESIGLLSCLAGLKVYLVSKYVF